MQEPRRFPQVLAGPRQVGKTTLARQRANELGIPFHHASADEPTLQDRARLNQQWDIARALTREERRTQRAVDAVQVRNLALWKCLQSVRQENLQETDRPVALF